MEVTYNNTQLLSSVFEIIPIPRYCEWFIAVIDKIYFWYNIISLLLVVKSDWGDSEIRQTVVVVQWETQSEVKWK